VQFSRNNTFTQVVSTWTASGLNYTPTSDLPLSLPLFWRVRANGANGPGAWSDFAIYTTGNPPGILSLLSPASNALVSNYTPLLDWSDARSSQEAASFDHYVLQIADNAGSSNPLVIQTRAGEISNSSAAPATALPANTKYSWRVQACNTKTECSAWSATRTFRTALPVPVGLAADGSIQDLRPNLSWGMPAYPLPNATGYALQFSKNNTFTQVVSIWTATGANYTPSSDLPRNLTLYWRVRANGANGSSAWSGFRTYATGNPPSIPAQTAPANNALTTNYTLLLDWSNSTVPLGPAAFDHYQLQVNNTSDFTSPLIDLPVPAPATNSSFTPATALTSNTKYSWRMQACNTSADKSGHKRLASVLAPQSWLEHASLPSPNNNQLFGAGLPE
jgi:hypothetical protein